MHSCIENITQSGMTSGRSAQFHTVRNDKQRPYNLILPLIYTGSAAEAPPPPHLLGGLVSQLGRNVSEGFPIGSSLLTGGQDGAVRLAETGNSHKYHVIDF